MSTGVSAMTYDVRLVDLAAQSTASVRGHVDVAGLPAFLGSAFEDVLRVVTEQHLSPAGPPYGRFRPTGDGFDVEAGFPVSGPVDPSGRVDVGELPGGSAAEVMYRGSYDEVAAAYEAVAAWLAANGLVPAGEPWESYLDGPEVPVPRTVVRFPCRPA